MRSLLVCSLGLASLLFTVAPARAQSAQAACVPSDVEQALSRCALGARRVPRAVSSVPVSHLPTSAPAAEAAEGPVVAPMLAPEDFDPTTRALREIPLLLREIETIERILTRLDPADPRAADYLFRLAESQRERERQHVTRARSLDEEIFGAERAERVDRARSLRAEQAEAEAEARRAREGAIVALARLLEGHPSFARADEVLFTLAAALEDHGQSARARQVHLRLVRDHPQSRFVPHAWLAFAEHAFESGDMDAARQFYERVLEAPPPANPLYGFALYKLAWVHVQREDFRGALEAFARVLEHARAHPDTRDAQALTRQALRELVIPYARVGSPARALAFFRRLASSSEEATSMMESLAELYTDTGQWPESVATYHALMAAAPRSPRLCAWQSHVTQAVIASRPRPEQEREIARLLDIGAHFATSGAPEPEVQSCRERAARAVYETAVAWHREAVGTGAQPGTRDRRTMTSAAALYDRALRDFPDLESIEMPGIAREDWPTPARLAYARAELAYAMEDWSACGPAFDRVVELDPEGGLSEDAAYASLLCYDHVYQTEHVDGERPRAGSGEDASLAPRELTDLEARMLASFARYVCVVPRGADLPVVQYRRARVYYVANRFEEAATLFRSVAFDHPEHELAELAANLYLDSLNGILRREGRASCRTQLAADLEPIAQRQCADAQRRDAHVELCRVVDDVRCGLLRQSAEALGGAGRHREAAAAYLSIFQAHGECGGLDEVLYDAAIHYEAARLLGRAIRAREVLVERFPESPLVGSALHQLGANHHALAIYGRAAEHYEAYARRFPEGDAATCAGSDAAQGPCPDARAALENAVLFRLGLGDEARAFEDARLYERSYGRRHPTETASVVFALGAVHERRGDWARVDAHYRAFLRDYGRSALPYQVLRAHVQLGRAQWESGRREEAIPHFRSAERQWTQLAPSFAGAPADEEQALQRAGATDAASEALFHLAEQARIEFESVRLPRFSGPATLARVDRWSRESLGPWLVRKMEALRVAEQAYARLEPLGVPAWRIAGAARVGEMLRSIVDDVRGAPVPEEIASVRELLDLYDDTLEALLNGSSPGPDQRWDTEDDVRCPEAVGREQLSDASLPAACAQAPLSRALQAFEHCLGLATRVRWFSEWSGRCEAALNDLARADYPLAAELRGTASFEQDELAVPEGVDLSSEEALVPEAPTPEPAS